MIRIITDTLSDFTLEQAKELGIELMALSVRFGEESYQCCYEMTNEQFYEKLVTSKDSPSTAAVNAYDFEQKFKECLDAGDEVLAILFTQKLSATYQSAVIAKNNLNSDKIHLIDTTTASVTQGLLVKTAVDMRDAGKSIEEIEDAITKATKNARFFAVLDTLEYLKRGGRISPTVAFVGGVLGLHPVVSIKDGKVDLVDKVKGNKTTTKWLVNQLQELPADENFPIFIGHTNAPEKAKKLAAQLTENSLGKDFPVYCIGPSIGTHLGPGTVAIGYISK